MKNLIVIFFLLIARNLYSQAEKLPVHWEFYRNPIYQQAITKYKENIAGGSSVFNFFYPVGNPSIGIILCNLRYDNLSEKSEMEVWGCFDESWKNRKYDFFGFSEGILVLINTSSGVYPSNEEWSQIVQDRVYIRPKKEKRLAISWDSKLNEKLILREFEGNGIYINDVIHYSPKFLRVSPYNYRELTINHKTGFILVY